VLVDAAALHPFAHSTVMLTAGVAHDTRDLLFAPTSGRLTDVTLGAAYDASRAKPFARLRADARRYRRVGSAVLAFQAVLQGTEGRAPVDQIVVIGSNTILRGYEQGRHRDNWLAGAQGEWRQPTPVLRGRLSLAAFAGGAVMARRVNVLASGRSFPSFGGGVRYRLDARSGSAVRIDFGKGRGTNSGLYVAFNEAF
jgi:hemolysin activation/secretion protein